MAVAIAVGAATMPVPSASAAPEVHLTGPGTAAAGAEVRLTVKTAKSLAGERAVLKKRVSGEWKRVARKTLGPRGYAAFLRTHSTAGTHRYRAYVRPGTNVLKSNRTSIVVQAPVAPPTETPPPVVTPPSTGDVPTGLPPNLPPLPDLPPYPGDGTAFSSARTTFLFTDNLDCGSQGYVGTRHEAGVGNGAEWEVWVPTIWYWSWSQQQWVHWQTGLYNYRDSASHPFTGGAHAWQISPSGATNAYSQWYWPVERGWYYMVVNYDWSASHGWSWIYGHEYADSAGSYYCYAY